MTATTSTSALILIAVAVAGAGVSYHFTLESRFTTIEQKLEQNSLALQQYQVSQDTAASSKSEALTNLSKEVDALQTSMEPLGRTTREQTGALADIRKQISSLQQAKQAAEDAQKKLADYAGQLEKIRHDIQAQAAPAASAPVPAPVLPVTNPAAATNASPQASSVGAPLPLPPRAESAVDLRPAQTAVAAFTSIRVLPVALPVSPVALPLSLSAADNR